MGATIQQKGLAAILALGFGLAGEAAYGQAGRAPVAPRPNVPAAVPAPAGMPAAGWNGYATNPGAWAAYAQPAPAAVVAPGPGAAVAPRPGWPGYGPGGAWVGVTPGMVAAPTAPTPGPASARGVILRGERARQRWTDYQVATGPAWESVPRTQRFRGQAAYLEPQGGRPHPYQEFGTGRMVPLGKPWLPGSP